MPRRHYFTVYDGPSRYERRYYPWPDMLPGDYLIDPDVSIRPCGRRWDWCKAYNAAKNYEKSHRDYYFTGQVEHDANGEPIGVRVTRELGQFMRSNESMWKVLKNILTDDEFKALADRLHKQPRATRKAILRAELEKRLMPREHPLL